MRRDPSERPTGPRRLAWEVLWRVERKEAYADLVLRSQLGKNKALPKRDKALAHELVMGVLRWQSLLDKGIERLCHRPLKRMDPKVLVLLRLGLYQLHFLSKIPARAAIDETVSLARERGLEHACGFINALLREAQRKGRGIFEFEGEDPLERVAHQLAHPLWMVKSWVSQWGLEETKALCEANNRPAPLTIRTNTLKTTRDRLMDSLREEGVKCSPTSFSPEGIRIEDLPVPLEELGAYGRGELQVQDEASQLMAHWLEVAPGQRVLDACAAPGGKTIHLAQLMRDQGEVIAADIHDGRLALVKRECQRLGISCVNVHRGDLTREDELPEGLFHRILLDAPCSSLGVLRRHPEAKWRRRPDDIPRLAELQWRLLSSVALRLHRGGILLYSVCTLTEEEGPQILERAHRELKELVPLDSSTGLPPKAQVLVGEDGILRTFPHKGDMDGFMAFRLRKV
jgi:16S rRNA (cytosine967-C5)-methyltransferase